MHERLTTTAELSELHQLTSSTKPRWMAAAMLPLLVLAGCGSGGITRVEMDPATQKVCDSSTPPVCGISAGQTVKFKVWGQGKCDSVGLKFGDGSTAFGSAVDFGTAGALVPLELTRTYNARLWPGPKTVHAYSASNCIGEDKIPLNVLRVTGTTASSVFRLAYAQPTPTACSEVPNTTPLRRNTKISIATNPAPNVVINFGCVFGGCIHDANGVPGSVAPPGFAFPGLAKYSLVLRVGTQVVQGGTSMSFTTNQGGPLEVCVNDELTALADNTGAWGINITVDESQAP